MNNVWNHFSKGTAQRFAAIIKEQSKEMVKYSGVVEILLTLIQSDSTYWSSSPYLKICEGEQNREQFICWRTTIRRKLWSRIFENKCCEWPIDEVYGCDVKIKKGNVSVLWFPKRVFSLCLKYGREDEEREDSFVQSMEMTAASGMVEDTLDCNWARRSTSDKTGHNVFGRKQDAGRVNVGE